MTEAWISVNPGNVNDTYQYVIYGTMKSNQHILMEKRNGNRSADKKTKCSALKKY